MKLNRSDPLLGMVREGLKDKESRRRNALVFVAKGRDGDSIRQGHKDDTREARKLYGILADEVDKVLAEGITPEQARQILGV